MSTRCAIGRACDKSQGDVFMRRCYAEHLLALGMGLGAVWARGRALRSPLDESGLRWVFSDTGRRALGCCWCRCACRNTLIACHTRSLPSRHGTLTQRISSVRGGPLDAIGLPPVRVLVIRHDRCLSLAERRPLCTRTRGSWTGATRAPEGEDHVKGQAGVVCKRNGLLPLTL